MERYQEYLCPICGPTYTWIAGDDGSKRCPNCKISLKSSAPSIDAGNEEPTNRGDAKIVVKTNS